MNTTHLYSWGLLFALIFGITSTSFSQETDLSDQVVIRRTAYGVPHIMADNMLAAGYALGYLQVEDYGKRVVYGLVRGRGEWSRHHSLSGKRRNTSIDNDASSIIRHERAEETFSLLNDDTRDMLDGFAAGVNRYITRHPTEFPEWIKPNFTGIDVHARGIGGHNKGAVQKFIRTLKKGDAVKRVSNSTTGKTIEENLDLTTVWARLAERYTPPHIDEGSNAWALAPSRTTSGKAILLRNPHLSWNAGYYEAHMTVPGKIDFYGDFRIGTPLGTIGGYNVHLGFSTTNNNPDTDEIYALAVASDREDHYLLDGKAYPLEKKEVAVQVQDKQSVQQETRTFLYTPYGPVIHRDKNYIYIIRDAGEGSYRLSEQFLGMMMAMNLDEYLAAMRIQAKPSSNFTYADAEGNIHYVWNAMTPDLPHASGGDTTAVFVERADQIWKNIVPFDKLPQLLNPKGGYIHQENDPFHYTNLNEVFSAADFPAHFSEPQLRLRSQQAIAMIANDKKFSLEDVIKLKYNTHLLLADRVKTDLIRAVRQTQPTGEVAAALKQLADWDNTADQDSKGAILFEAWWKQYVKLANGGKKIPATPASAGYAADAAALFEVVWSPERPAETPYGLASEERAVQAFKQAIAFCNSRYGSWNLPWGEVNRARIGHIDMPISGATGELGCFNVLWFIDHKTDKQKREVRGGDGWVLAVEFGKKPRAYSVLAYGESNKLKSPYFADQLDLYARKTMKKVVFSEEEIAQETVKEYRPGKEE